MMTPPLGSRAAAFRDARLLFWAVLAFCMLLLQRARASAASVRARATFLWKLWTLTTLCVHAAVYSSVYYLFRTRGLTASNVSVASVVLILDLLILESGRGRGSGLTLRSRSRSSKRCVSRFWRWCVRSGRDCWSMTTFFARAALWRMNLKSAKSCDTGATQLTDEDLHLLGMKLD